MRRLFSLLLCLPCALAAVAQLQESEVWLYRLQKGRDGRYVAVKPVNVSRRVGYDNQPFFSADGRTLYFVSHTEGQADIFTYRIRQKQVKPFTRTSESEYSPQPAPDGLSLTAVTVERDSAQRLHYFDLASGARTRKLETDSIGYYRFLTADTLVFFKLTEPPTLRWRSLQDEQEHVLGRAPVRGFCPLSPNELVFGLKDTSGVLYYLYDMVTKKARRIGQRKAGGEDLSWHRGLGLLVAEDRRILKLDETTGKWETFVDLAPLGATRITRFAISGDGKYLAAVDNP